MTPKETIDEVMSRSVQRRLAISSKKGSKWKCPLCQTWTTEPIGRCCSECHKKRKEPYVK